MRHRAKQKTKGEQCPPFPSRTADYRIYADDIMFILERFTFEMGETRGGGTAPPGPK